MNPGHGYTVQALNFDLAQFARVKGRAPRAWCLHPDDWDSVISELEWGRLALVQQEPRSYSIRGQTVTLQCFQFRHCVIVRGPLPAIPVVSGFTWA